jgi:hypothetical protein
MQREVVMTNHASILLGPLLSALLSTVACGPTPPDAGEPCDVDEGAQCRGRLVLLCTCPAPDDEGACPADDASWERDAACGCDDFGNMVCS